MWCWNRYITETTPGWTSAELEISFACFLVCLFFFLSLSCLCPFTICVILKAHMWRILHYSCLACFTSRLIWVSWCFAGGLHRWQLSYTHTASFSLSVFMLTKEGRFFLHPPLHFPQCCFCFFLAVQTNICFVRVTSHIPNHRESCSQRQQTGADPEIQLKQAHIKRGIAFHMFWLKLVKL